MSSWGVLSDSSDSDSVGDENEAAEQGSLPTEQVPSAVAIEDQPSQDPPAPATTDPWVAEMMSRLPQSIEQRTPAWYQARHNMLTASDVASVLGMNKYKTSAAVLSSKLAEPTGVSAGTYATAWGTKYEPMTARLYEILTGQRVNEVGLFVHRQYGWLGASPDGIVADVQRREVRLTEFKNIMSRVMNGEIPHMYWVQMQIQLEVLDVAEVCDYLETKYVEWHPLYDVEPFVDVDSLYVRSSRSPDIPPEMLNRIIQECRGVCPADPAYPRRIPRCWKLVSFGYQSVPRDRQWFASHIDTMEAFWQSVLDGRSNPNAAKMPPTGKKPRAAPKTTSMFSDD